MLQACLAPHVCETHVASHVIHETHVCERVRQGAQWDEVIHAGIRTVLCLSIFIKGIIHFYTY